MSDLITQDPLWLPTVIFKALSKSVTDDILKLILLLLENLRLDVSCEALFSLKKSKKNPSVICYSYDSASRVNEL